MIRRVPIDAFRWNEWNLTHATRHGVGPEEIEAVVRGAARPYPQRQGRGKWVVIGRGTGGRFVQVIYLLDADGTRYVIHAMPVRRPRR
jgi:hypothetical protein